MKMEVTKSQRGASLRLNFPPIDQKNDILSDIFNINDFAEVRFKSTEGSLYIAWKKHESVTEAFTVKMNILCKSEVLFPRQVLCHQYWTEWVKIKGSEKGIFALRPVTHNYTFEVIMCVSKVEKILFANLYEDDEFCDFNLNTINDSGSVPVHKACLIVHSDIFKRMLSTEWKETINGCIKIQGVTLQNLKHLKEYFYLGTLPDDTVQIQPLLLIAKCYMIKNLMTECILKLALTVKPEELHSLEEFSVDNQIPELVQAIVQITPDETVHGAHQIEKDKEVGPPEAKKSKCDENSET